MRRGALRRLAVLAGSVAFGLLLLDLVLRLFPSIPGPRLANYVFSRYGVFTGGIYVRDPVSRVHFMWPGYTTETAWNGYRWRHSTDGRGFRNPQGAPHELLLLGDSLIYGHGVEETETVAHFLRAEWGRGAYNLGRQGACLLDEYVFLRTWLAELAPRDVVLTVFLNDFHDLTVYRTAEEIARAPELAYDYAAIRRWAGTLAERQPNRLRRWVATLPSIRLLRGIVRSSLGPISFATPAWAATEPDAPEFLLPLGSAEQRAVFARYYRRLFADLAARTRDAGARLHVVYLSAGAERRHWNDAQERAIALLADAAAGAGLPLFDTRPEFAGCEACFLPADGHYSPAGHRRLAELLATRVLAEPVAD